MSFASLLVAAGIPILDAQPARMIDTLETTGERAGGRCRLTMMLDVVLCVYERKGETFT